MLSTNSLKRYLNADSPQQTLPEFCESAISRMTSSAFERSSGKNLKGNRGPFVTTLSPNMYSTCFATSGFLGGKIRKGFSEMTKSVNGNKVVGKIKSKSDKFNPPESIASERNLRSEEHTSE